MKIVATCIKEFVVLNVHLKKACAPVTHPDASAVVLDLQELQPAFFHRHLDIGGFGIQTATLKTTRWR